MKNKMEEEGIPYRAQLDGARPCEASDIRDARMGIEFSNSNYDNIKKVYSIWICTEAPQYIGNAISTYDIHKTDIVGAIPDIPEHYDKLCVIIICLNEKQKSEHPLWTMV